MQRAVDGPLDVVTGEGAAVEIGGAVVERSYNGDAVSVVVNVGHFRGIARDKGAFGFGGQDLDGIAVADDCDERGVDGFAIINLLINKAVGVFGDFGLRQGRKGDDEG